MLQESVALWWKHPLFGSELGAYVATRALEGYRFQVLHSVPGWLAAELGLLGLVVFGGLLYVMAQNGVHLMLQDCSRYRGQAVLLLVTVFLAMGVLHDVLYQRIVWYVAGLLLVASPRDDPPLTADMSR